MGPYYIPGNDEEMRRSVLSECSGNLRKNGWGKIRPLKLVAIHNRVQVKEFDDTKAGCTHLRADFRIRCGNFVISKARFTLAEVVRKVALLYATI